MSSATATTTTTTTTTANHVFVFPYPAQGHMLPLLDLTHQLALKGLKITILVTPKNLPTLDTLLSTHPNSINTLILPFPTHPNLPLGVENVKDIGNAGNTPILLALKTLEEQVINWFQTYPCPPNVIVSDFFLGYTNDWALKLKIPRIAFFSSGAFMSCIMDDVLRDIDALWHLKNIDFPILPRSPSFIHQHLPTLFKSYKKGNLEWMICKEAMIENFKSYGIVFNSFDALEGEYLDYVKKIVGHNRVYSVGPLSEIGLNRAEPDLGIGHDVLNWLDKCPNESVVYVCFGSQKMLDKPQMDALALGLERSETRFVWVVKSEARHLVPDGFEKRIEGRGLVVYGWAPQKDILNHKSTGGFISHCGWNSSLECIIAGVMILAWPMEADQFINARLLVEYMECGVRICEGGHTVPNPDDFSRVIIESIGKNIPPKEKAKMVRDMALEAINSGGSSMNDLDSLVKELEERSKIV